MPIRYNLNTKIVSKVVFGIKNVKFIRIGQGFLKWIICLFVLIVMCQQKLITNRPHNWIDIMQSLQGLLIDGSFVQHIFTFNALDISKLDKVEGWKAVLYTFQFHQSAVSFLRKWIHKQINKINCYWGRLWARSVGIYWRSVNKKTLLCTF